MLIELVIEGIYNLINLLMAFAIPRLPDEVTDYFNQFFDYINSGVAIIGNYVPIEYLLVLFGLIVAIDAGLLVYKFVLWVLKKVPILGIE